MGISRGAEYMIMVGLGSVVKQGQNSAKSALKINLQRNGRQGCLLFPRPLTGALRYSDQSGTCCVLSMGTKY